MSHVWLVPVVQTALSVLAVLVIVGLTRWMGLGTSYQRIRDEAHAIALADEAECGFDGISADVDAAGYGAIVRNRDGAAMLVRVHGNRYAARRITPGFTVRLDRNRMRLDSGERRCVDVDLDFGQRAGAIAARLRNVL